MFKLLILVTCVAGALGGFLSGGRVVRGQSAASGQFPYQVSMRHAETGSHHCGGTIFNEKFIVTAAHCIYNHYVHKFVVVVGSNYLNEPHHVYELEKAIFHIEYDPSNLSNDIALLKTISDIEFNNFVQPLPMMSGEVPDGVDMILSGWPGNGPPELQYTFVTNMNLKECGAALQPNLIFSSQICTFTKDVNEACLGTTGDPLVYQDQLAGILSWGKPCISAKPEVFTKVSAYIVWIEEQIP